MSNPIFAFKLPGKNSSKTSLSDSAVNLAGRRLVKLRFGGSEIHGICKFDPFLSMMAVASESNSTLLSSYGDFVLFVFL